MTGLSEDQMYLKYSSIQSDLLLMIIEDIQSCKTVIELEKIKLIFEIILCNFRFAAQHRVDHAIKKLEKEGED